jgi:hypothetical protein
LHKSERSRPRELFRQSRAFSFQPVLLSDYRPVVLLFSSGALGQAINAVTGTRIDRAMRLHDPSARFQEVSPVQFLGARNLNIFLFERG